jgi:transposase
MPSITPDDAAIIEVTGGVDTHLDTHTAAAIDPIGRVLGTQQFPATPAGYAALLAWMRGFGPLRRVGIEGTGAYGAGLARRLRDEHLEVIEVDRPDRKTRRFRASPTRSTPSRPLRPPWPANAPASPSSATAASKPCVTCG